MPSSLSPLLVFFLRVTGIEASHFFASDDIWDHSQGQQKLVVFNTTSSMLCTEDTHFINRHFSVVRESLITWAAKVQNTEVKGCRRCEKACFVL
jgi:hypothetical protein